MSLYRQDSTGFLCEFASPPGAGYTSVSAMPADLAGRVSWWRSRDVDAALGQSSAWHPSIQAAAEDPYPSYPDLRAGSGANVAAYRYAAFEEGSLPPLSTSGISASLGSSGYLSAKYLQCTATTSNGICYLASSSTGYNIKLTPNKKWIISVYCAPTSAGAKSFSVRIKTNTSGAAYDLALTTGSTSGAWTRATGVIDLSADSSPKALMAIIVATSGAGVRFDAIMMEEQVGTGTDPSAFNAPVSNVNGSQLDAGSVPDTKLISIDASTINVANLNATNMTVGTINGSRFGNNTIGAGPIISGVLHRQYGLAATPTLPNNTAITIQAGSYASGAQTIPANTDRSAVAIIMSICNNTAASGATQDGHILFQLARGSTTGLIASSLSIITFDNPSNITNNTGTVVVYEPVGTTGTGTLTYYFRAHHCVRAGTIAPQVNWLLMEFSKS